jgi:CDGSH-type Zn-finger protein/uncharacterized Fe-S cluster protein YjdI
MRDRRYEGRDIDVTYNLKRCIHAAECVRRVPAVFDTGKRPWIQPDQAASDEIAAVILRCPSGALHYERKDGGAPEPTPDENTIQPEADGPLYLHGDLEIVFPDGTLLIRDTRLALCRCGASGNKPFCDNTHREVDFTAPDPTGQSDATEEPTPSGGKLTIKPSPNGPLLLRGNFEISTSEGQVLRRGTSTALCRCGSSANKPFCDGTHSKIGFKSEPE